MDGRFQKNIKKSNHGGSRAGSGRKPGSKNKLTLEYEAALKRARRRLGRDREPLDYVLSVMRNQANSLRVRFKAAKIALPFCHKPLPPWPKQTAEAFPLPPPVVLIHTAPPNLNPDERDPHTPCPGYEGQLLRSGLR